MKHRFFTADMKMSEIFHTNLNMAVLLPRLDMDFGFAEKTVAQCCQMHGVDCDFFLMIGNVYTFEDYLPDTEELHKLNIDKLLEFLLKSHKYYMEERLPHIENHLEKIVENVDVSVQAVLKQFYADYKQEVWNHFEYEEDTVFPYIRQLLNDKSKPNYQINQFEQNHSNIEDKLADLINIIIKYLPGKLRTADRISMLQDLNALSADLNRHALIEDQILLPFVEYLEKQRHENN